MMEREAGGREGEKIEMRKKQKKGYSLGKNSNATTISNATPMASATDVK